MTQWQSVAVSGNQLQSVAVSGSQWQSLAISGSQWQSVAVSGSQWQSVAVCGSLNFYRSIITTGLSAAGAKTNSALPTILSWPFLESLEFLEILRILYLKIS